MEIQFTGHNLEITPGIKTHTEKKMSRISSHGAKINAIHVTFHIENKDQVAKAVVLTPGYEFFAQHKSHDLYESIDRLVEKLLAQLDKHSW
jgi:putative sigma-54 modulation protein